MSDRVVDIIKSSGYTGIVFLWLGPVTATVIILLLTWYIWRLVSFYAKRKNRVAKRCEA